MKVPTSCLSLYPLSYLLFYPFFHFLELTERFFNLYIRNTLVLGDCIKWTHLPYWSKRKILVLTVCPSSCFLLSTFPPWPPTHTQFLRSENFFRLIVSKSVSLITFVYLRLSLIYVPRHLLCFELVVTFSVVLSSDISIGNLLYPQSP